MRSPSDIHVTRDKKGSVRTGGCNVHAELPVVGAQIATPPKRGKLAIFINGHHRDDVGFIQSCKIIPQD